MTEATVVIKGRNDLSAAVRSAERDLRGLLKQGELIGKVFRGGAVVAAVLAFERLAESAERAAIQIGDQGTAKALRQLNREIDNLKAKGTNLIGQVLGESFIAIRGNELQKLEQRARAARTEIELLLQSVGGDRTKLGPGFFEKEKALLALEERVELLRKSRPFGERDRAPGSRGGGQAVYGITLPKEPRAGKAKEFEIPEEQQRAINAQRAWMELRATIDEEGARMDDAFARWNEQALESLTAPVVLAEKEWSAFAEQAARNLQDSFAQFLFDPFQDGLKGMLGGFVDMLRRMVAELAAQELLKMFFNWGSGLSGGVGEFFASMAGSWGGTRAIGGPVSAGRAYLVGERGPEMFVPGTSGGIIPNGGGGLTIAPVYNVDARGATQDVIAALPMILEESSRRTVERAKAELRGDLRRYGRIR